jgi:hypothetical protein
MGGDRQGLNQNRENNPMQSSMAPLAALVLRCVRAREEECHIITV